MNAAKPKIKSNYLREYVSGLSDVAFVGENGTNAVGSKDVLRVVPQHLFEHGKRTVLMSFFLHSDEQVIEDRQPYKHACRCLVFQNLEFPISRFMKFRISTWRGQLWEKFSCTGKLARTFSFCELHLKKSNNELPAVYKVLRGNITKSHVKQYVYQKQCFYFVTKRTKLHSNSMKQLTTIHWDAGATSWYIKRQLAVTNKIFFKLLFQQQSNKPRTFSLSRVGLCSVCSQILPNASIE